MARDKENYNQYMKGYMLDKRGKKRMQELKEIVIVLERNFKRLRAIFKNIREIDYSDKHKKKWEKQVERRGTLLKVKPLINKMDKVFTKLKVEL